MILRPRQIECVEKACAALGERDNTLVVAPTGAGKTVMLSAVAERLLGGAADTVLVLQHRDELVAQNRKTFHRIAGASRTSGVIDASSKAFRRPVTFAMVQTLVRNLDALPPQDVIIVDEAHHVAAPSYRKIIEHVRAANPKARLLGVTATPNRGDKRPLIGFFDNVADQITLGELIATGALVPPRTFVADIGVRGDLAQVRRTAADFDMAEVAKVMDRGVLNEAVVSRWRETAGDRMTVVFCSTVEHARHVTEAFTAAGVLAACVEGDMPRAERAATLRRLERGEIQVVTNCAVLTEGWDCQPVGCVVLLRPSSWKSTMIQMVGRGLRRLDPDQYPGWPAKNDCIVIDFGTSILTHGSLEQDIQLDPKKGEMPRKRCPECESLVPAVASECAVCGHAFQTEPMGGGGGALAVDDPLRDVVLTEIDVLSASPFRWEELHDGLVLIANAFDAWAMVVSFGGQWHALGGARGEAIRHIAIGERMLCLAAADDYMREHGDADAAAKSKTWLHMAATDKQRTHLGAYAHLSMTRYQAACLLTWKFNERAVRARLEGAARPMAA